MDNRRIVGTVEIHAQPRSKHSRGESVSVLTSLVRKISFRGIDLLSRSATPDYHVNKNNKKEKPRDTTVIGFCIYFYRARDDYGCYKKLLLQLLRVLESIFFVLFFYYTIDCFLESIARERQIIFIVLKIGRQ